MFKWLFGKGVLEDSSIVLPKRNMLKEIAAELESHGLKVIHHGKK